jgi:adenosine deaminase
MEAFIANLPKAELHIHIEGSLEPELMYAIAARNGLTPSRPIEETKRLRTSFADLGTFLDLYYEACEVLISEADFYDLAAAYLERAVLEGVTYAEIFFDPQTHLARGVSFATVIEGLTRAAAAHKDQVTARFIMCFLRDKSEAEAIELIRLAEPFKHLIYGVGLDSYEVGNPGRKFAGAYAEARRVGLCGETHTRCVAHAGEEESAALVIEALSALHITRIDHGVRSLGDPYLLEALAANRIPLTVCPNSNKCLKVSERFLSNGNAAQLLHKAGVLVTINSDDPAYFGGYIVSNYLAAIEGLDEAASKALAREFARNSFLAGFLTSEERSGYLERLAEAE